MYIDRTGRTYNGKKHTQILLRESFRVKEDGKSKVKHRTLLNLTKYSEKIVTAIEAALKNPDKVTGCADGTKQPILSEGRSIASVCVVYQIAKRLGIVEALGTERGGQLALWQVIARLLEQGSRLSAVRLAKRYAIDDIIGLDNGFNEDHLYENLHWLAENQQKIEDSLYQQSQKEGLNGQLFLYDVTSSYLEGEQNELANYGYNRDGKKGKKQIVIGLLCDAQGEPLSVEVFSGNTNDVKTFSSQIEKALDRFGCQKAVFVGDRGMIKSAGIKALKEHGYHFISALTRVQVEKLIREERLSLELFDEQLCEVLVDEERLILRRNPIRASEIHAVRISKKEKLQKEIEMKNEYLAAHPRANVYTAVSDLEKRLGKLNVQKWLSVKANGRHLELIQDEESLTEISCLDGCYVLRSDLLEKQTTKETLHERYKDLAQVEQAFRVSKTAHLELRPIYVRKEASTRGHVFVVMLAYKIRRELSRLWTSFDCTVEEGLGELSTLCLMNLDFGHGVRIEKVPQPRKSSQELLTAAGVRLPETLAGRKVNVDTKKKLNKV